jgi:hypothetical protein
MALGCVRVDLTVRLGRGVEGFDNMDTCIFRVVLHVAICVHLTFKNSLGRRACSDL